MLDVRFVDVPAGVTQEGHTGFLHLPFAVLALIFLARRIQPFLSLVDREVEFRVTNDFINLHLLLGVFFPSSCDDTEVRTHVPTSEGFEVPTEPPGRPAEHHRLLARSAPLRGGGLVIDIPVVGIMGLYNYLVLYL